MKLIKIVSASNVIRNFVDESLDSQLAYKLMKFATSIEEEVGFFNTQMQKIVDKYAQTDDEGKKMIPPEKINEFNDETTKLQDTEVESPKIRFTISELSPLKMTMRQMFVMSDFIDDSK